MTSRSAMDTIFNHSNISSSVSLNTKTPMPTSVLDWPETCLLPLPLYLLPFSCLMLIIMEFLSEFLAQGPQEPPTLHYKQSALNNYIVKKCKLKERRFQPDFWIASRLLQTLLPHVTLKPEVTFEREYLQMRDRGVVALDWVTGSHMKLKRRKGALLVIPNVADGAAHVAHICAEGTSRGFQPVVLNPRGHGGSVLTTAKLQSFWDPSDLKEVLRYVHYKMVKCPVVTVAYGAGCGQLLSYLGVSGEASLLTAAVCISPCYRPPSASRPGFYDFVSLLKLKGVFLRHVTALSSMLDVVKVMTSWTFPEFIERSQCPFYGCASFEQLWSSGDPVRSLQGVRSPLLCVHSSDDPVSSEKDIPNGVFQTSGQSMLTVVQSGGHCGFLRSANDCPWSDALSLDYLQAVMRFYKVGVSFC